MRSSMVEFHDIMWDLDYTKSFEEALNKEELLYEKQPSLEDFRLWRDVRLMREIHWFGWFIDYWMEVRRIQVLFLCSVHHSTFPKQYREIFDFFDLTGGLDERLDESSSYNFRSLDKIHDSR